jgi:hypothetical protein
MRFALAHIKPTGAGTDQVEDALTHQPVMHNDVRSRQQARGLDGQQVRIAGARAHQPDTPDPRVRALAAREDDQSAILWRSAA